MFCGHIVFVKLYYWN